MSKPTCNKHRRSDAKWRANVTLCYETLKFLVPDSQRTKRSISKASVLQQAGVHIDFLEDTVNKLFSEHENIFSGSSPKIWSLEDIRNNFSSKNYSELKEKRPRKLRKVNPDHEMYHNSQQTTSASESSAPSILTGITPPTHTSVQQSPVPVYGNISNQLVTPKKKQEHDLKELSYASPDSGILINHPAFLTPTKLPQLKVQCGPQELCGKSLRKNIAALGVMKKFVKHPRTKRLKANSERHQKPACCRQLQKDYLADEYDDKLNLSNAIIGQQIQLSHAEQHEPNLSDAIVSQQIQLSHGKQHEPSLSDAIVSQQIQLSHGKQHEPNQSDAIVSQQIQLSNGKQHEPSLSDAIVSQQIQLSHGKQHEPSLSDAIVNQQIQLSHGKQHEPSLSDAIVSQQIQLSHAEQHEPNLMKSLAQIWHGLQPCERDTLFTLASLPTVEPGEAMFFNMVDDTAVVPESDPDFFVSQSSSDESGSQLVPETHGGGLMGEGTYGYDCMISLSDRGCCDYNCFSHILHDMNLYNKSTIHKPSHVS